jgi:hypothetical protein
MYISDLKLQPGNRKPKHFLFLTCFAGAIYHTVTPSLWHADISFVDTKDQPNSPGACRAAFELSPGTPGQVRNASCTPPGQLFRDLYGVDDPLNVRGWVVGWHMQPTMSR